jgi:hypothetical protein
MNKKGGNNIIMLQTIVLDSHLNVYMHLKEVKEKSSYYIIILRKSVQQESSRKLDIITSLKKYIYLTKTFNFDDKLKII